MRGRTGKRNGMTPVAVDPLFESSDDESAYQTPSRFLAPGPLKSPLKNPLRSTPRTPLQREAIKTFGCCCRFCGSRTLFLISLIFVFVFGYIFTVLFINNHMLSGKCEEGMDRIHGKCVPPNIKPITKHLEMFLPRGRKSVQEFIEKTAGGITEDDVMEAVKYSDRVSIVDGELIRTLSESSEEGILIFIISVFLIICIISLIASRIVRRM